MTQKIKKVAVIGTGLLGTQISMLSAYAGYKVSVYDHYRRCLRGHLQEDFLQISRRKESIPLSPGNIGRSAR